MKAALRVRSVQRPRDARREALRIEPLAPAVVHWSLDGWRTAHDEMTCDRALGMHVVDLATTHLPQASASI